MNNDIYGRGGTDRQHGRVHAAVQYGLGWAILCWAISGWTIWAILGWAILGWAVLGAVGHLAWGFRTPYSARPQHLALW